MDGERPLHGFQHSFVVGVTVRVQKSSPHASSLTQFSLPPTFAVMHVRCPSAHVALAAPFQTARPAQPLQFTASTHALAPAVYSLGVLLFIMLTGRKPWALRDVRSFQYAYKRLAEAPGLQDPRCARQAASLVSYLGPWGVIHLGYRVVAGNVIAGPRASCNPCVSPPCPLVPPARSFLALSSTARSLLLSMLADDPAARPSAAAVLRHPFLTQCLAVSGHAAGSLTRRHGHVHQVDAALHDNIRRRIAQLASLRWGRSRRYVLGLHWPPGTLT